MNDLDEKKWLVSRIDMHHNYLLSELQSSSDKLDTLKRDILSSSNSQRNIRFSALAIALTILFGVAAIYPLEPIVFFPILATIIVVGLIIFIAYNYAQKKAEEIFSFLETSIIDERYCVEYSFGFIISKFSNLSNLNMEVIENYFNFSKTLFYATKVNLMLEIKKYAKKYKNLSTLKPDFDSMANELMPMVKLLHNTIDNFDSSLDIPPELLSFVNETVSKSKKFK